MKLLTKQDAALAQAEGIDVPKLLACPFCGVRPFCKSSVHQWRDGARLVAVNIRCESARCSVQAEADGECELSFPDGVPLRLRALALGKVRAYVKAATRWNRTAKTRGKGRVP